MSNSSLADQSVSSVAAGGGKSERILSPRRSATVQDAQSDPVYVGVRRITRFKTAKCFALPAPRSASDPGPGRQGEMEPAEACQKC